ncbi:PAS domain S-box protein, partial [Lutibacter sp.]|uniref:PAS domain S-box protein n=1 Tax=Lutibacter sp. TaxID=1925666 RepID=UPI0034A09A32
MELFKQIFDLASEGILILNSDGIIQKINSSSTQIFGYSKNEILQKNVSIIISPIDIDAIKLNSKKTSKTSFNSYGFKKSGLQFPLILKSEITQINKGTQIILFVTDLTTSKLKTETLIANKKHIEETQNIAHIGSWFWNLQTNEKDWSGEFYKIYDLEPNDERLNPDNVTQFIHPDDKEEAITKVTKAIKNHQPFECENRIVTQKGNIKHTISKGKAIYNKNGEPIYIMGTLQDVTELKKTTIELTESNRKFDALISNLPGLAYRSKNDKDRTTEYMSRGCFTITGYKPEQFISKKIKFGNIIVPDDKDFVWEELQKALAKKTTFNIEYRIQHKNRNLKNVWEQGKGIFDDQGNLLGIEGFILDITEKKQTEEKLRANEAKNKALLEAIPDIMLIQDLKGDFLDVYANQPEMLIVPKNEIIGKNMVDILPNKLFKKIKKAHQRALKTKQIQIENFEINNKGKAEMHESRIVLLNNHKILSIVRDITNQKKLEKELKQSEAKKTAILQALPDLIFVLSEKGSVLEIHESDSSVLFTPKEDLLGKNIKTLLPKKGSQKLTEALSKVLKTKKMEVLELSLLANNSIVKYETRMVPLEDNKILTIARDITKNKEIEELLSIRNKALEFAMNGIIIVDAKKEDAPIIYCNKSFSELTGYSKDEIIGKNCRFLQNDDRDQKEILIMKSAIEEGKPCQVVLRNYRKDGSMFWNELNITPIFSNTGKPTHFIGVQKDVTARKKALILKDQIRKILEMITQNKPIKQIGDEIVKTLKNNLSNSIPSMLLLNNEKKTLHNLSSVNLPNNYKKSIEGLAIGSKTGSCGTAAYLKKDVIVTNIANDPLWKNFKNNALKHNLKSCWSFPIYSSTNTVLGVLAVYSSVPRNPNDHELQLIADITQLASVAIEQHTSNITLQKNNIKLQEYTQKLEENVQNRTNELSATVQQLVETNLNLEDQVQITKEAEKLANTSQAMFSAI